MWKTVVFVVVLVCVHVTVCSNVSPVMADEDG